MMISKSAATEIITDYCLLLEKQTEGFTREQLLETVQFLYWNKKSNQKDEKKEMPEIELGEDMKTLYLRLPDKTLEKITTDNFRVCVNYVELIESKKNAKAS